MTNLSLLTDVDLAVNEQSMATTEIESRDVVRLILQFLKENSLQISFESLQNETGVSLNTVDNLTNLRLQIINGKWDIVLQQLLEYRLQETIVFDVCCLKHLKFCLTNGVGF